MEHRYRTNLKKVFLTDQELLVLNHHIAQSQSQSFSAYARKVLLNPEMGFISIDTNTYQDLVFELKRIGNNINQIARAVNQSHLLTKDQVQGLRQGIADLVQEVEQDFDIKVKRLRAFYGQH